MKIHERNSSFNTNEKKIIEVIIKYFCYETIEKSYIISTFFTSK